MRRHTVLSLLAVVLLLGFATAPAQAARDRRVPIAKRYTAHAPAKVRHGQAEKHRRAIYAPEEGRGGRRAGGRAPKRKPRAHAHAAAFASSPTPRSPTQVNAAGLASSYGALPPDTGGAIGPAQYIEGVTQRGIGVYDRFSMKLISAMPAGDFVGFPGTEPLDAQFMWDPGSNRWYYAYTRPTGTNPNRVGHLDYGWSKTADPTDLAHGWCRLEINTGALIDDRPKLAATASNLVISTNVFNYSGNDFSRVLTAPKPANGSTSCPGSQSGIKTFGSASSPLLTADGDVVFSPAPAMGADDPANGYVVAADSQATASQIMAWHVDPNGNLTADGNINVPSFANPPLVPQPGGYDNLDSVDDRLTQAVAHYDPDAGAEAVWTQQTTKDPSGSTRSVVRWYELVIAGCNGTTCPASAIRQRGVVDDPSNYVFNAAISPTMAGNEAVVHYNVGSSTLAAQIRARSRASSTPLGQMGPEITIDTSAGPDDDNTCGTRDTRPGCRWGDYEPATPDPINPHAVWGTSETNGPTSSGNPSWRTRNFGVLAVPAPFLQAGAATLTDASGDGVLTPGEGFGLSVPLLNIGSGSLAAGNGTLSSLGGATLSTPTASYPAIAAGATGSPAAPFKGTVSTATTCGTKLNFNLAAGGATLPLSVQTGIKPPPPPAPKFSSTDVPKAIPDNNPAGVTSTINVSSPGTVNHLTVSIDRITHTYDGDLKIELIGPDGTDVVLVNRTGGGGDSGDNFIGTVFDDAAAQSIYAGAAPYTGRFRPDQALSAFNGKSQQGTWTLKVSDLSAQDTGTLSAWSETPQDTSAPAPAPSNAIKSTDVPKAIPDNNPAGVTSTINVTNPGTVNHLTVSIDSLTHTYDGDLKMELIAPDGTDVVLVNRTGGGNDSGDNFTNTLFDDGAAQSIYSGTAPYSGSFRPDQALSAFDGKQQQGTWTLKVSDLSALDKGTLNGWSLTPSQPTSATPAGTPIVRSSTDVPKSIPDNSTTGVTSTISVPDAGTLASLTVTVGQLTHTWDGDLKIELIGPDGTDVVLADRPGTINNGADNFTNTVFDDTSAVNLTDGASPYSGTYRPQVGALSAFAGKPIKGTWTLKVSDLSPGDTGSLGSWKLSLVPAVCG